MPRAKAQAIKKQKIQHVSQKHDKVIEKCGGGYMDVREHNKRMMEPFAPIHMVTVQQFIDKPKHSHAFVMDADGKIYDPGDKNATSVACYSVEHIMGFLDDRI